MNEQMKGIACCGDCAYYDWKKHRCPRAKVRGNSQSRFYVDCPLHDVRPVVHGYWWTYPDEDTDCNGNLLVWCSECDAEDHHVPGKKVPFCWHCGAEMSDEVKRLWEPPNCGADMREEQEHNG